MTIAAAPPINEMEYDDAENVYVIYGVRHRIADLNAAQELVKLKNDTNNSCPGCNGILPGNLSK
jgi:hypothetical protein